MPHWDRFPFHGRQAEKYWVSEEQPVIGGNRTTRRNPCPSAISSTINAIYTGLGCKKLANNSLSYVVFAHEKSAGTRVTPADGFSLNLIFEIFNKICP
jgi:hypothetical protein